MALTSCGVLVRREKIGTPRSTLNSASFNPVDREMVDPIECAEASFLVAIGQVF
jgi:hypothetical protein